MYLQNIGLVSISRDKTELSLFMSQCHFISFCIPCRNSTQCPSFFTILFYFNSDINCSYLFRLSINSCHPFCFIISLFLPLPYYAISECSLLHLHHSPSSFLTLTLFHYVMSLYPLVDHPILLCSTSSYFFILFHHVTSQFRYPLVGHVCV